MNEITIITITVIPFLLIVLILIIREITNLIKSLSWPSTTGELIDSGVINSGSDGGVYSANIQYQYAVNGRVYKSRRIAFLRWWGSRKYAQKVVDKYSNNNHINVYYNPNNPRQSVLERKPNIGDIVLAGLGIVVIIVGAYLSLKQLI